MVPFIGQGGCQAIEDSVVLAAHLQSSVRTEVALKNYERERRERTRKFVLKSRQAQSLSLSDSAIFCCLRDLLLTLTPKKQILENLHSLTKYDLPQI